MEIRNVFLVGPMGSGKTTIGQRLAGQLGLEFHDTDQVIQDRTGVDIGLIFDIEGEEGFREREARVLEELTALDGVLIATGGGTILRESNRNLLRQRGTVIYLQASVEQQMSRLRYDKTRPLIQHDDREGKLVELAEIRDPLYAEVADLTFPAKNRSVDKSVGRIVAALQQLPGKLPERVPEQATNE
jgi:shikimate kinase